MSGSKHTPGPWTVRDTTQVSADLNGKTYDIVTCHAFAPGEQAANAKLIAAAPDMANLLEEWRCFVLHGTSRRYSEREMLEWTAAVLAKAGL